jgi:serine/threonine protein phosphatase PrpC
VSSPEMIAILEEPSDVDEMTMRLIQRANENGGPDNITCIVARWRSASLPPPSTMPAPIPGPR